MNGRGAALGALLLLGCDTTLSSFDPIYSRGADHFVLCAQNVDDKNSISTDDLADALTRAKLDGTTLHLYTHRPGDTVETSTVEDLLAAAVERGVGFVTYEALTAGEAPGTVALSFDDHNIASWIAMRPLLARYHARVTFFISAFTALEDSERAAIHQLADDGHDIEYHSVMHKNAADYAGAHGIAGYLADEITPALDAMRAAGYATTVFAYPFGARTAETDAALAPYFVHLRAIRTTCPN
jgi:Polysaccharide deacetylase